MTAKKNGPLTIFFSLRIKSAQVPPPFTNPLLENNLLFIIYRKEKFEAKQKQKTDANQEKRTKNMERGISLNNSRTA
jgi:hypothetical protein